MWENYTMLKKILTLSPPHPLTPSPPHPLTPHPLTPTPLTPSPSHPLTPFRKENIDCDSKCNFLFLNETYRGVT